MRHQQYLLSAIVELIVNADAVELMLPVELLQCEIPEIAVPSDVAVQFTVYDAGVVTLGVVDAFNFKQLCNALT